MNLTLSNRRYIPALDFRVPAARSGPWLQPQAFSQGVKEQLRLILEGAVGRHVPDDELFSGGYDTFRGASEVPLECWDVVDDDGKVRYQFWLFGGDSGALFANESVEVAGAVCQCGFESELPGLKYDLKQAYERGLKTHPESRLAQVRIRF